MVRKYNNLPVDRERRLTLDMTGCKCLGEKPEQPHGGKIDKKYISICGECAHPLGQCPWLLYGVPFKGSEYYWFVPIGDPGYEAATSYIIASCPKYVAP